MSSWDSVVHATAALAPPTSSFSHYAGGQERPPSPRRSSRGAKAAASALKTNVIDRLKEGYARVPSLKPRRSPRFARKKGRARGGEQDQCQEAFALLQTFRQRMDNIEMGKWTYYDRDLLKILAGIDMMEEYYSIFENKLRGLTFCEERSKLEIQAEAIQLKNAKAYLLMKWLQSIEHKRVLDDERRAADEASANREE